MDFPSFWSLFRVGRDEILARSSRLTRAVVEREGSDANALVAVSAAIGDEVVGTLASAVGGLFLDSATGDALDRLAFDRYGLTRKQAAPALGTVSFTTSIATTAPFSIPSGTKLQTADNVQFVTTAAVVFPAGSVGPVYAAVRSVLAGLDQQAKAGTITSISAALPGAPVGLVVTNALATAGAADRESDASLRARGQAFFPTVRRGTLKALEQGALAVAGVETATGFELVNLQTGMPDRGVYLAVSDTFTEALVEQVVVPGSALPVAYQAQAQTLATAVLAGLSDVRAAGIPVYVVVASVVLTPVYLALSYVAGVDVNDVAERARAAVVATVNALPPGTTLTNAALRAAVGGVSGLVVTGNEIVSPNGDIVPTPIQALRTSMALVTIVSV
jgi:uncharacterized phage protein gp47/JayE